MIEHPNWSVFDGVKKIPASPEALIAEINSAISAVEYSRATAFLKSESWTSKQSNFVVGKSSYNARKADEAYKAGMAAMAAGKLDDAIVFMNIALSNCPPDRTSAVSKLQSLISITSQQLQKATH